MNKYIIWSDIDVPNEKEYAVEYESYLKDNELQVPENSKDYERGLFEFIYHLNKVKTVGAGMFTRTKTVSFGSILTVFQHERSV